MSEIMIRSFESRDREAVRRISCETAFLGQDRRLFIEDDELLADALVLYYTDYEPRSCFVAVDGDRVVGYIIGTTNVPQMEKIFSKQILPGLIKKAFRKGFFCKKSTWGFLAQVTASAFKGEFYAPHFSKQYPAMLHINIDENYRGRNLGTRLIGHFLNYLKLQGATGVHFGTMSDGAKIFFLKSGFELLHESKRSYLRYRIGKDVSFYIFGKKLETGP